MKKSLLILSVFAAGMMVNAQDITAVTGLEKGKIEFHDFRKIDLNNLENSPIIFAKSDDLKFVSESNKKSCTCDRFIAAMTIDTKGDVFYLPMSDSRLMMIDAHQKSGNLIEFKVSSVDPKNQATHFARMTTGSDGMMYALNNDGTELLRVTSNGTVVNMGSVRGMQEIANQLGEQKSIFGGDMIADAFGHLYVLSAMNQVIKIDLKNLTSEWIGKINGLPANFTTNGAAVTREGKIILGTTSNNGLYEVDFETLEAKFVADYNLPIYDLASNYFLKQNEKNQLANAASFYSLYPTIVKTSTLSIVSKSQEKSVLSIGIYDLNNKEIFTQNLSLNFSGEFPIHLNGRLQPGIYILKAVNQNGNEVINTKFTLMK